MTGGGVYGKTLMNPQWGDFSPRVGFAYSVTPKPLFAAASAPATSTTHVPARAISRVSMRPQAQFAAVTAADTEPYKACSTPVPAQIIAVGTTAPSCYVTSDQGFPTGLVTTFNPATDNITWVPKDRKDSYVENYFLSVQRQLTKNTLLDVAYVGNHGLHLEGFVNANQRVLARSEPPTLRGNTPNGPATSPRPSMSSIPTTTLCRFVMSSAL